MIFLTVGTQFPFDRLVRGVDRAAGAGEIRDVVFAQVGIGGYKPEHLQWVEQLDRGTFIQKVRESRAIIAHAGMGTILTALEAGKPLLVMPRQRKFGEAVNDHQTAMARRFAALGHVLMARDETELPRVLPAIASFRPSPRRATGDGIVRRLRIFLDKLGRPGHGLKKPDPSA